MKVMLSFLIMIISPLLQMTRRYSKTWILKFLKILSKFTLVEFDELAFQKVTHIISTHAQS